MGKHTQTIRRQFPDKLFECVWPICGIDVERVKFIVYPYFEKSLEEQVVEINNVSRSSLKFTFGQGGCRN